MAARAFFVTYAPEGQALLAQGQEKATKELSTQPWVAWQNKCAPEGAREGWFARTLRGAIHSYPSSQGFVAGSLPWATNVCPSGAFPSYPVTSSYV